MLVGNVSEMFSKILFGKKPSEGNMKVALLQNYVNVFTMDGWFQKRLETHRPPHNPQSGHAPNRKNAVDLGTESAEWADNDRRSISKVQHRMYNSLGPELELMDLGL